METHKIPKGIDKAIEDINEDDLNYASLALGITKYIVDNNYNSSTVVGINAPWGSGKTSLFKLIEESLTLTQNGKINLSENDALDQWLKTKKTKQNTPNLISQFASDWVQNSRLGIGLIGLTVFIYMKYSEKLIAFFKELDNLEIGIAVSLGLLFLPTIKTILQKIFSSGKHLAKTKKDNNYNIVHFNPWTYDTSEEIASHFFRTLSTQVNLGTKVNSHFLSLAKVFEKALLPTFINQYSDSYLLNKDILSALDKSKKVIVFIDDLDRMDIKKVKAVFKMLKCIADFPNFYYILGYHKAALIKLEGLTDEYFEKIIQQEFKLPHVSNAEYVKQLEKFVEAQEEYKSELCMLLYEMGIDNMRQIKRFKANCDFIFSNIDKNNICHTTLYIIIALSQCESEVFELISTNNLGKLIADRGGIVLVKNRGGNDEEALRDIICDTLKIICPKKLYRANFSKNYLASNLNKIKIEKLHSIENEDNFHKYFTYTLETTAKEADLIDNIKTSTNSKEFYERIEAYNNSYGIIRYLKTIRTKSDYLNHFKLFASLTDKQIKSYNNDFANLYYKETSFDKNTNSSQTCNKIISLAADITQQQITSPSFTSEFISGYIHGTKTDNNGQDDMNRLLKNFNQYLTSAVEPSSEKLNIFFRLFDLTHHMRNQLNCDVTFGINKRKFFKNYHETPELIAPIITNFNESYTYTNDDPQKLNLLDCFANIDLLYKNLKSLNYSDYKFDEYYLPIEHTIINLRKLNDLVRILENSSGGWVHKEKELTDFIAFENTVKTLDKKETEAIRNILQRKSSANNQQKNYITQAREYIEAQRRHPSKPELLPHYHTAYKMVDKIQFDRAYD